MKKITKSILLAFIINLLLVIITSVNFVKAEEKTETSEYASYTEQQVISSNFLGYGIEHLKVKAISSAFRCTNQSNTFSSLQTVNVLSVPSRKDVRIVNYTYSHSNGWIKQTLSKTVEKFEQENPGWVVLAGVNGDFYDINGNDKALPYHTTGTTLSNGDLLRAVESKSIGYTNNGTSNSFLSTDRLTFTDYHVLTIYDNEENVIKTFKVDLINEVPTDNEIAVYYTYKKNVTVDGSSSSELIKVEVPKENSFIVSNPIRCLPTSEPEVFAKGKVDKFNENISLDFGDFAIVTNNQEVKQLLKEGTLIRVQKEVTGELANCDQIQAVGSTLMKDGQISLDNSDGMRTDRHPRTCIGVKEDGTLMFFVIDGRQISSGMCGMTQDEEGVLLKYYGCKEGYNIDGGGSSTMGIRNEYGEFVVMNSPSDGKERSNSNYLLVVVPELKLELSEYTDTSVKFSYDKLSKGISVENIVINIDNKQYPMKGHELVIEGLNPKTNYEVTYEYDLIYNNDRTRKTSLKYSFKTANQLPTIPVATFDIVGEQVNVEFEVYDKNKLATLISYEHDGKISFINQADYYSYEYELSSLSSLYFKIKINYDVDSNPPRTNKEEIQIKWFPSRINLSNYYQNEIDQINVYTYEVNEAIASGKTKEEVIEKINLANQLIDQVPTKEKIQQLKSQILQYLDSIDSSKYKNKKKVQAALDEAKSVINQSISKEEILMAYNKAKSVIEPIKKKNCKTETLQTFSMVIVSLMIVSVCFKKKQYL